MTLSLGDLKLSPIASQQSTKVEPIQTTKPEPMTIEGLSLLDSVEDTMVTPYKDQLAELPSLDELAEEFNNPDQPEAFDDAALAAIHKVCISLEASIDNAEEVRNQLTFIMTELKKYPETAAKLSDSDIHTMVKALRANYNVVAFAKQANKAKKTAAKTKVKEDVAALDALGLFDGLDL